MNSIPKSRNATEGVPYRNSPMTRWQSVLLWFVLNLAGCGPSLTPVRGKVMLADGKPAAGSQVVFESDQDGKKISARGDVRDDGSFELSTFKPRDGVPPGKYKVQVNPPPMVNAEGPYTSPFNAKYSSFQTSGLEFEVKSGAKNEFPIQVTK
jgi:hypothetical protein